MQPYTLELFRKNDTGFELRILHDQTLLKTHWIAQSDIDELYTLTAENYRINAADLVQRGQQLYQWIDQYSENWLSATRLHHPSLALTIDIQAGAQQSTGLGHLPWELLHDGNSYLCEDPIHLFTPLRRATPAGRKHEWQPQKRQLGVLFMASSPEDIEPILDFEAEEAGILNATAKKPLDLQVEESGSLQGLQERLSEYRDSPDVIHINGHAGIDEASKQPVFLLENELGHCHYAPPDEFARCLRVGNAKPRLVFLSGCRTGESNLQHGILSYSEQLVNSGIVPIVLGWALPVGDIAASEAAAILYEKLANGFGVAEAVAQCRQQLLENGSPFWHLLRCYVDGSALNPLVSKGRLRSRKHNIQQVFLDAAGGNRVPVCSRNEFIGRRRLLQRSLSSLRAYPDEPSYAEGVLLYGMGGLGKSSVAARLVDRLVSSHKAIVNYGGLDETGLIASLGKVLSAAQSLLNDVNLSLEQRLEQLFSPEDNPYCDKPLLLVLDDFEQNVPLEQRKQANPLYRPECLSVLNAILQAIHNSQSDCRVIITSRFDVPAVTSCHLHKENPQTLRGSDLNKKLAQLGNLQLVLNPTEAQVEMNKLRIHAIEIAAGNPRLLERLDFVFAEGKECLPVRELLAKLESSESSFREDVLIKELVAAQTGDIQKTLACASIYRLPVTLSSIEALRSSADVVRHLQKASEVGLVEINKYQDQTYYFISRLLLPSLDCQLDDEEKQKLAAIAAQDLYKLNEERDVEPIGLEVIRLSIEGKEQEIAVLAGLSITSNMLYQNRFMEADVLCQKILALGEDPRLLTQLSKAALRLGSDQAYAHAKRAVELIPQDNSNLSEKKLRVQYEVLFNLASILTVRGELNDALAIYQNQVLGIAITLNDELLRATVNLQIVDILTAMENYGKAYTVSSEVLSVFMKYQVTPLVVETMHKIAGIHYIRKKYDDALDILESTLPKIDNVRLQALAKSKMADILRAQRKYWDAIPLYSEAFEIFRKLEDIPSQVGIMEKIASVYGSLGNLDREIETLKFDVLPVYERLKYKKMLIVCRINLAKALWNKNPEKYRDETQELFFQALRDARDLGLPVANTIKKCLESRGMSCPR